MQHLLEKALENKVFANLFAAFLVLLGFIAIQNITVKLFPELNIEAINITVAYPGAAPSEVEDAIVIPIEEQLQGLEGVRKVTSVSSQSIGSVLVSLRSGEDLNARLNDIKNEVEKITVFPQSAEPPIITISDPDELAVQIVLHGNTTPFLIKQEAQRLRSILVDQSNISDVKLQAAPEYLVDILLKQNTLREFNLSLPELATLIRNQNQELSAGEIEGQQTRRLVRTVGENKVADEFKNIVVRNSDSGTITRLSDIAAVKDSLTESPTAGYFNGRPSVILSVFRVGDEQVFDVVEETKTTLNTFKKNNLSATVQAEIWRDESSNLKGRIDLLTRNAIIGILLVALLLMLTLDLRIAKWVAFGVGVSFIGSFTLLSLTGYTINQLSLFGFILAIGIVVDDAIVVGENIFARRKHGDSPSRAAQNGVSEVALSVLVSTLTTIAVFLPLLFIPGIYGQFMGPIAAIVIFVLILSLFEAFFILPRHLSNLTDETPSQYSPRHWVEPAKNWTSKKLDELKDGPVSSAIEVAVNKPFVTLVIFAAAFSLSLLLIVSGKVKFVFFPEIEGNYVTAQFELVNSASKAQSLQSIKYLESTVQKAAQQFTPSSNVKGDSVVRGIFSSRGINVGNNGPGASNTVSSAANIGYVTVKIEDAATRNFTAKAFERAWRETSGELVGAKVLTFSSSLVSAGAAVAINVRSRNEKQAMDVAKLIFEKLNALEGVTDIRDDRFNTIEEVQLSLKPEAANYGVTLNTLAMQIRANFFGSIVTRVQRDREEVDVRVRLVDEERSTLDVFNSTRINVNGSDIPLSAIANIAFTETPFSISRKDGQQVITLSADIDTRVSTGGNVTDKVVSQYWPSIASQYPEVSVGVGGDQEEQQRAGPAIAKNFIISLFVVYALLALVFSSYTQPVVIMSIIPFGFMGALLGHFMLGLDLTILSMFGVIGLSGVIINDALLLMEFVNRHVANGMDEIDAIKKATKQRFRPILLTSLTTFLGVTPIIFEPSVQAKFLAPTAVSLGVGILFATLILIFLLPAIATLRLKIHNIFK